MSASTTDGFSAWVSIDGVKLPQYGVETTTIDGAKTVRCWIVSEVNKAFEVGWSVPACPDQLGGFVYVDEMDVGGSLHLLGEPSTVTQSSKRMSDTVARPLIFSEREFTDRDAYLSTHLSDQVGEIAVEISVVELDYLPTEQDYEPEERPAKFHEYLKKALPHRVSLGEEFAIAPPMKYRTWIYKRHVVTFIFKYTSRDFLQAEGIIHLHPEQAARPHKRAAETCEPSPSEDEGSDVQFRCGELRLYQEELRAQKDNLEEQKLRIRKEEMRIYMEEQRIRLNAVEVEAKTQRKKAKLEPLEATLQEIIDLT